MSRRQGCEDGKYQEGEIQEMSRSQRGTTPLTGCIA